MLSNGNFENGWWRETFTGQEFGEIFVPQDWVAFWKEEGNIYRPEMKVIPKQAPFLDPPRIQSGNYALQYFKQWGLLDAGIFQQITIPSAGMLSMGGDAHAWYSQRDRAEFSEYEQNDEWFYIMDGDPGVDLMLGIDPTGGQDPWLSSVHWHTEHIYDTYQKLEFSLPVEAGLVTVYLRAKNDYPFKHVDIYWDNIVASHQPAVSECRGTPREQYKRTYHLLPQTATKEQSLTIAELVYPNRGTVGFSADDAGIGDLDNKTVNVIHYTEQDWEGIDNFFQQYYPGTQVEHTYFYDPEPPSEPEVHLRSNNVVGLHSGYGKAGWDQYLTQALPTVQKCFSGGFALEAKRLAPDALIVWRKYADHDVEVEEPLREKARELVDLYDSEIHTMANNTGITYANLLAQMNGIVIETLNEKIPTFAPERLQQVVEFDIHFCELVHDRFGGYLRPGILTAAIGNPHETEVHYLVPAARAAVQYNGLLGYHGYWTANENQDWLEEKWQWHAGRWTEWDKVFVEAECYPEYYLGEGGIVYSTMGDDFNSGKGWKSCGSFEKYLMSLDKFQQLTMAWNAEHGNRCHGLTVFGYGNWGWDDFEIGEGDLLLLKDWAVTEWLPQQTVYVQQQMNQSNR